MKTFLIFCSLLALAVSEISNKYDLHHSQHEQSVNAAKQVLQERLSKFEAQKEYGQGQQYGNSYGSSGSEKYVAPACVTCYGGSENRVLYNSRQSSSSSSQLRNSHAVDSEDYTGVGIVGHSNDARFSNNDEDNEDMQSIVAPTYIGSSGSSRYSSSRAHEAEDMQQRVVPADLSSVSSSAYRQSHVSEHDEDDLQNTVVPVYKPVYNSRVYSQSRGGSAAESSRTGSVVPAYVSGGSTQTQSHRSLQSESELSESRKPVPVGQYVSISARPGSSNVLAVPVRVINTQGVPDDTQKYHSRTSEYSSGSDTSSQTRSQNPTSTTYRVVYNPSRNYVSSDKIASTSDSENSRTYGSVQQPEKLTSYNSYSPDASSSSQSRFHSEDSASNSEQVRVAPVTVSYPINGGSSRFATGTSSVQQGNTHSRAPVFPINTIESSSSSRTAEERDQRRYTPASPTYISSSRNSELEESRNQASSSSRPSYVGVGRTASGSDQQSSSQYGSRGSTYFLPAGSRTQTQTQQQSGSNTQYQQQSGSNTQPQQSGSGLSTQNQRQGVYNYSPYTPSRTSGSHATDRSSSRFDSSRTDDLSSFMTEAERKARLQQQQISGSSSNSANSNSEANRRTIQTASNLDSAAANFVRTSNLANRNSEIDSANIDGAGAGAGAGGYSRVRSWNKQSKWSSGSEYGPDGKPKSYSTLSTGEAEKYNINGAEAGYKAATSTLENDGKVSTYSQFTPNE